ncbi:MAG TPA: molybdopterin-dependent oxidoreductase [Candidatus Saccharimonadales bacterium]|nr:molybdopterin-dependent oxidoreductase [Candidatus Saccharimonadales bacterium]
MPDGLKRRDFLKLVGLGGAGLAAGCGKKAPETVLPFAVQPEDIVPGIPTFYASACRECPAGCGLVVTTREGRAIKLEGNPEHPLNRGGLCARGQAGLQALYHPDRLRTPVQRVGQEWKPLAWDAALALLAQKAKAAGARSAVLTGLETGALDRLVGEWLAALGSRQRLRYEAYGHEALREATRLAFGRSTVPSLDFAAAKVVFSLGADFLETWLNPVGAARGMADGRGGRADGGRFVAFAARQDLTASNADELVSIRPGSEMSVALGLLHVMLAEGLAGGDRAALERAAAGYDPATVEAHSGVPAERLRRLAREFAAARPGLAVAGGVATQGDNATGLCLAVHLLNHAAGNVGRTVNLDAGVRVDGLASLRDVQAFIQSLAAGAVELLVVHGANPAFTLPAALGFEAALRKVPFKVSLARQLDETAELCDLVLPASHSLESWEDAEPVAGVRNLLQPSMRPVFGTRSAGEIFFATGRQLGVALPQADFLGYLQDAWKSAHTEHGRGLDFAAFWNQTVQAGGVFAPPPPAPARLLPGATAFRFAPPALAGAPGDPVLLLAPSALFYDGRDAGKPWLQELPDPSSKVVWGSWLELSPATAQRLGVREGDVVEVEGLEQKLAAPALVCEGLRDDVVALPLGQGHTSLGRWARGRGVNPFAALRPVLDPASGALAYLQARVKLVRAGRSEGLVNTAYSTDQLGRGIAQVIPLADLASARPPKPFGDAAAETPYVPRYKKEYAKRPLSGNPMNTKHRWGMAVDLDRCTGCSACVTACYAENNIMVVGPKEAAKHRIMSWIRIEKFHERRPDGSLEVRHVPMTCQQCDNAPCETVCPVYATYHNPEGINAQIYNRCIGTRYCSNNCPYRVRRFNYVPAEHLEPLTWQFNPDVTVRSKGVMEKCTFCVQRITAARDQAKDENRDIRDGEVVPACASSCPAQAIAFGDLDNPESRVARLTQDPRGYRVFEVLNTQPNVNYLRRVRRDATET